MAEEERSPLQGRIEQALRDLASNSAGKRRKAAYFLGEAANGDAVPTLIELYKNDRNPGVRRAAAYALGQFKAIDAALGRGEEAKVTALLRAVENRGDLGRRAPVSARLRLILSLILSLVLIGVLYLFHGEIAGAVLGGKTDRTALLSDIRSAYNRIGDDTRTLQQEYLNVISGRSLSCVAYFNNMPPYVLDPRDASAYKDINNVVAEINAVQRTVVSAREPYDTACASDPNAFMADQANNAIRTLVPAVQSLAVIELDLTTAEANTVPPTAVPTAVPTAIPPTAVPPTNPPPTTAPVDQSTAEGQAAPVATGETGQESAPPTQDATLQAFDLDRTIAKLYDIVDQMNGARGAATLLVQYWEDVGTTGTTSGCDVPTMPDIPENDVVIPESQDIQLIILRRAVDVINNGLVAVQRGWTDFIFACNSRNLVGVLPSNIANARAAQSAFASAAAFLDQARAGGVPLATPTTGQ